MRLFAALVPLCLAAWLPSAAFAGPQIGKTDAASCEELSNFVMARAGGRFELAGVAADKPYAGSAEIVMDGCTPVMKRCIAGEKLRAAGKRVDVGLPDMKVDILEFTFREKNEMQTIRYRLFMDEGNYPVLVGLRLAPDGKTVLGHEHLLNADDMQGAPASKHCS